MAQLKDLIVYGDAKFLGDVTLDHDPTTALHAATKAYVDAKAGSGTDEKLKVAALTSGTTYLPILAVSTDSGAAATRQIDKNAQALKYICTPGTSGGAGGTAQLILGNSINSGYVNSATGILTLYGANIYGVDIKYNGAYINQTLLIPGPTANDQTNYFVTKVGSAAIGAADQPVYIDSSGHVVAANKNLWGFTSNYGIFFPNDVSTTGNTFGSGSLTVLGQDIKGLTGIRSSMSTINMLGQGNQNLSASTAAGSTTYVLASSQNIGANSSNIVAANTYYYSTDGLVAQKPTSVDNNGSTLTFASTLNPNSAISKISFANYDSGGMSMLCGAGLTNTAACNLLVGLKIYTTGYYNLAVGSLNYVNGYGSAVTGIRNYVNASYALTTGYGNTNVKDGAFVSGVWHDTTNGPDYLAAVGKYSNITSTSAFVVGNGTSTSARSNAFEVTITGEAKAVSFTENGTSLVNKYAAKTHTHGDISSTGIITTNPGVTIASGDALLIADSSVGGAIKKTSITFGTSTTTYLRNDGTWAAPSGGGGGSSDGPFYVAGTNSIACATSSPYYSARWKGTNSSITSLYTGLTINFKIDVAGNGSYGTVLNINNLGEHPVCANVNTYVSTRYAVGCIIPLVYDADQTATAFINSSSSSTITGVWKIADYDSTNTYTFMQAYTALVVSANAGTVYRNQILLSKPDLSVIPVNNVKNGPGTYNKTLTSQSFDPFGPIYYFNYTGAGSYNPGNTMPTWYAYRVTLADIRYSFNINSGGTAGTTALTAYRPVYIKALYDNSTKQATLAPITSSTNYLELSSLTQSLPSTNPNNSLSAGQRYIYIYLGHAYDKYRVDFAMQHQVYTWNSASNAMQEFIGAPMDGSGTFTVTDNTGSSDTWSYYKIGKQVTVSGKYTGSSSALSLQGLPFTVKFKQVFFLPVQITSPSIQLYSCQVTLTANATTIGTYGYGLNATSSWLSFAKSAGTQITFSYITDD